MNIFDLAHSVPGPNIWDLSKFITNPPYRSKNKIKHILKNDFNTSISDADLLFNSPPSNAGEADCAFKVNWINWNRFCPANSQ